MSPFATRTSRPFPNHRHPRWSGFTLVETLVVLGITTLVISVAWRLFSSGLRGSRFTHETIDHIRDSAILFRAVERDVQRMLPWPVLDSRNRVKGGAITFLPSKQAANELRFWIRNGAELQQIRYRIASGSAGKQVFREELNGTGSVDRTESFGEPMIDSFLVKDSAGNGSRLKVTVVFCSKLKKNTVFEKVFSLGAFSPTEASHWVYD